MICIKMHRSIMKTENPEWTLDNFKKCIEKVVLMTDNFQFKLE
ncbi:hypothetical protein CLORY_37280 [Clostridium oryzae]|uniref:Uncharacterized protein n=1 Tax=Clostridium oryzae TaxID=1450648 RepID=A0A1V4IE52_9CLOT|nr:hypothetical protein CLORY_37280 [Clostridium oryzae]